MALLITGGEKPLIFLHIPKTGGSWFRKAISAAGISYTTIGEQHDHFPLLNNYLSKEIAESAIYFALIRHPITWYQSRWAFRVMRGWQMTHPIDFACASNDFNEWVLRLLNHKPNGWVSELYHMYIDNIPSQNIVIGKIESILKDSVAALKCAGVNFDEELLIHTAKVNDSSMGDKPSSYWAKYAPHLFWRVMYTESEIINSYYNDTIILLDDYCGRQPF